MTAVGYISDTAEIGIASWSNFWHGRAAAFKLLESSPLPPALSGMDLPGGQSQVSKVCWIKRINWHPAARDMDSARDSILDTENWLDWNRNLDTPHECEDDCEADNESDIELDKGVEDPKTPGLWNLCAAPSVPRVILPTQTSKNKASMGLMTVNTMATRRNMGNKNNVRQSTSMYPHQVLYVVWLRISFR